MIRNWLISCELRDSFPFLFSASSQGGCVSFSLLYKLFFAFVTERTMMR